MQDVSCGAQPSNFQQALGVLRQTRRCAVPMSPHERTHCPGVSNVANWQPAMSAPSRPTSTVKPSPWSSQRNPSYQQPSMVLVRGSGHFNPQWDSSNGRPLPWTPTGLTGMLPCTHFMQTLPTLRCPDFSSRRCCSFAMDSAVPFQRTQRHTCSPRCEGQGGAKSSCLPLGFQTLKRLMAVTLLVLKSQ